jgi:Tol biopolymer transport system component
LLATGQLVYGREGALFSVPFDSETLTLSGTPRKVLDGVLTDPTSGVAPFGVSNGGTLTYLSSSHGGVGHLCWYDRDGSAERLTHDARSFSVWRLSPDGRSVVVGVGGANDTFWLCDAERGSLSRLSFGVGNDFDPVWSPDGEAIAFTSERGTGGVYSMRVRGEPTVTLLLDDENVQVGSWSSKGVIAITQRSPDTGADIWTLTEDGERAPFLRTNFNEHSPVFTRDGEWVAYVSDESGREEIHVRSFEGPDPAVPISNGGGANPRWNGAGDELFYLRGSTLVAVPMELDESCRPGEPTDLFEVEGYGSGVYGSGFDVAGDGDRFLFVQLLNVESALNVVHLVPDGFEVLGPQDSR